MLRGQCGQGGGEITLITQLLDSQSPSLAPLLANKHGAPQTLQVGADHDKWIVSIDLIGCYKD